LEQNEIEQNEMKEEGIYHAQGRAYKSNEILVAPTSVKVARKTEYL
jgi:hypothetical protein